MNNQFYLSVIMGMCCLSQLVLGVTVSNPAYQVETYLRYDAENIGIGYDFTIDSNGNIYVVHGFNDSVRNGSVQKIATDKTISALRSDLVEPTKITWGGGTSFGNYLYISDRKETANWSDGEVTQIDLSGNKIPFCGGLNQPGSLAIDRTGNYNNLLYIANSAHDEILSVGPSGGTATTFSDYPYVESGAIRGMAFDTTGNYGGGMFVGGNYTDLQYSGLFHIDTNGNESRYANFEHAGKIAFDNTAGSAFEDAMFAAGKNASDTLWTLYQVNGFYDTEVFGTFDISGWRPSRFEFGPDESMYVLEYDQENDDMVISRITPVPEPATLILLGLGGLVIRKRK